MDLASILDAIENKPGVLLYFSGEHCNVCHALRPKYEDLFVNRFPLVERIFLDAHEHPEIAAYFRVFSVPTAIVFLGGREFVREGRAVSLHALEERLLRPYEILTS
ncbi:thioredoxin family protein [Nitratifractor sp.]